jgi:hypothetical protein
VTPDQFKDAMEGLCKVVGMKTKIEADKLYLMNVRLTAFDGGPPSLMIARGLMITDGKWAVDTPGVRRRR